ncbi:Glu-tRNA(Gln) amidotransferase subunit GatD [Candidatus Woesearchaeota archaeon]|nr:Glu-tRNA(Gln) amidotransferase subunit GatD [Candidatus Woesearchaeota archaeon]
MANPGDKVRLITKDKEIEGILMPQEGSAVFIKRKDGYNIGIDKKNIKEMKVIEKKKEKAAKPKPLKQMKGKKKILVVHTGGTIASKVDYETGGVSAKFTVDELVEMVPELADIANIECDFVSNMMSEDMNFTDYKKIINHLKKCFGRCDGIIIGHGTDTLHYTAAALSFVFENPPVPIIVVGSQRSSDRGSSDAAMNLLCAAHFIAKTEFKGVAICMHHSSNDDVCAILPATKTRKMHTSRRDAFKAINSEPFALVDKKSNIEFLAEFYESEGELKIKDKFSEKVGLIKTYPNFSHDLLQFATKHFDALVLEATGLGHLPTNTKENEKNYELLEKYIKKGHIIAITSQCLYGRVHPDVYSNLRRLSDIGCIFCEDMLPETAYIKLSWLLGNFPEKAKELLTENLRGEISERTLYKEEFID